jgi:hypothetical protein
MTKQNVYVVLGAGRSGTSAIARGLKTLGIDLGDKLMQANRNNPKGYWEDLDIMYTINRGFADVTDHQWLTSDNWPALQASKNKLIADYQEAATAILKQRFSSTQDWGFKDPRTSMMLPFWKQIFKAADIEDKYVIAVRNPLASATSNQAFNESDSDNDLERRLIFWLTHVITSLDEVFGKQCVIVSYENMLEDPRKQLTRMHQGLSVSMPLNQAELDIYANEFIDKKLRHYAFSIDEVKDHPAMQVVPLCFQVYKVLMRLANDELSLEDELFKTEWKKIKDAYHLLSPLYHYIETLVQRNKAQQRQLRTIKKSLPWKMIYPFRLVDNILRMQRKQSNMRKKAMRLHGEK